MSLKHGLSGHTLCHNAIRFDYPVFECIAAMLPVCDEVVVCDRESEDGTRERLDAMAAANPKLRIISRPIDLFPRGEHVFDQWIELIRGELGYDMQFQIDADEILDPGAFDEIRAAVFEKEPRIFTYVNFWLDAQHHCPWGDCRKLHLAPTSQAIGVHGPSPLDFDRTRALAKTHPSLITYHYSALRKREAFFAKCRWMSEFSNWGYSDQGLISAENEGSDFMLKFADRAQASVPFTGSHPPIMRAWLKERGWAV